MHIQNLCKLLKNCKVTFSTSCPSSTKASTATILLLINFFWLSNLYFTLWGKKNKHLLRGFKNRCSTHRSKFQQAINRRGTSKPSILTKGYIAWVKIILNINPCHKKKNCAPCSTPSEGADRCIFCMDLFSLLNLPFPKHRCLPSKSLVRPCNGYTE